MARAARQQIPVGSPAARLRGELWEGWVRLGGCLGRERAATLSIPPPTRTRAPSPAVGPSFHGTENGLDFGSVLYLRYKIFAPDSSPPPPAFAAPLSAPGARARAPPLLRSNTLNFSWASKRSGPRFEKGDGRLS